MLVFIQRLTNTRAYLVRRSTWTVIHTRLIPLIDLKKKDEIIVLFAFNIFNKVINPCYVW